MKYKFFYYWRDDPAVEYIAIIYADELLINENEKEAKFYEWMDKNRFAYLRGWRIQPIAGEDNYPPAGQLFT